MVWRKGLVNKYVSLVQDIYEDHKTVLRYTVGVTDGFSVEE